MVLFAYTRAVIGLGGWGVISQTTPVSLISPLQITRRMDGRLKRERVCLLEEMDGLSINH